MYIIFVKHLVNLGINGFHNLIKISLQHIVHPDEFN